MKRSCIALLAALAATGLTATARAEDPKADSLTVLPTTKASFLISLARRRTCSTSSRSDRQPSTSTALDDLLTRGGHPEDGKAVVEDLEAEDAAKDPADVPTPRAA